MAAEVYNVVGWFARDHGLSGLQALLASARFRPVAVVTHRLLPRSQDPERNVRPSFAAYEALCAAHDIPLYTVDSKAEAQAFHAALESMKVDLFAVISWRRLIRAAQLAVPRLGGVNLHRGQLPEYAGGEPVVRALQDGRDEVHITAHLLAEEIDTGRTLSIYRHPVRYDESLALDAHVDQIKRELTPHFGPLMIEALEMLVDEHERARTRHDPQLQRA